MIQIVAGIPEHFKYHDVDELPRKGVEEGDYDPIVTSNLKLSQVLSDNAKRFALASELNSIDTMYILMKLDFVPVLAVYYHLGNRMPALPPAMLTGVLVAVAVVLVAVLYLFEDFYERNRIMTGDRKAAELGKDYLEGGIEYFEKQMQMNKALRELDKESGAKLYDEYGEIVKGFSDFGIPALQSRLDLLKRIKLQLYSDIIHD